MIELGEFPILVRVKSDRFKVHRFTTPMGTHHK